MDTMEDMQTTTGTGIEIVQAERRLAYERLTLLPSTNGTPLLKDLSISIPSGTCVLIRGSTQAAGVALFKATAGCSIPGAGRIIRPRADEIFFLAQRPYSPPGTLRQLLEGHLHAGAIIDDQLLGLLRELDLEHVLAKAGGLDTERDWQALLSLREQQLFALVRILLAAPQFAFLDQVGAELDSNSAQKILSLLKERSITYINIGEASEPADRYDAVLECADDGGWTLTTTTSGRIATTSFEGNENSGKGPS
jgi:putative ATP-binding cassette transporter